MSEPLTLDDIGLLLAEAVQVYGTGEGMCIHLRDNGDPLPSGAMTCGQFCRLVAGLIRMSVQMHPSLIEDDEMLETIIRNAIVAGAGGALN